LPSGVGVHPEPQQDPGMAHRGPMRTSEHKPAGIFYKAFRNAG
jgi:hypothetical protein